VPQDSAGAPVLDDRRVCERAELTDVKLRARPASHEVKLDEAHEEAAARVRHGARVAGGTA